MKNAKRVLAIIAIVLILGMYAAAFVLSFQKSEHSQALFRGAIGATILVPVLLYLILMVARVIRPQKSAVIDAIVFDVGLVLVDWPWEEAAAGLGISEEAIAAVRERVVRNPAWREFDRSLKPDSEIVEDLVKLVPEYEREFREIVENMDECCEEYWYTKDWIKGLKAKGYKLYYLSNWGRERHDRVAARGVMDFTKWMDGGIWSYECHEVKPEREIYQRLIRKYHLNPSRTLFIDDSEANVEGAKREGMSGIVFKDMADVTEKLAGIGVKW